MEPRISLITLGVSDLERSTRFYRDGLGLPITEPTEGVTFFGLRGTWLALFPRAELAADAGIVEGGIAEGGDNVGNTAFAGFSLAHNVGSTAEVEAVLENAQSAGARILKPAQETAWGGYSGYFADPDGFVWEVAWNPHFDLT